MKTLIAVGAAVAGLAAAVAAMSPELKRYMKMRSM